MDRKQIGTCGVDAGCLIIIDPCYLQYLPPTKTQEDWNKFCKDVLGPTALSRESAGQISYGGGGVIVSSGHGDGAYPVYAHYDPDGVVTKVEIVFVQDEEPQLEKPLWPIDVPEGKDPCKICTVDDVDSPPGTCEKCPHNPFNKPELERA